MVEIISPTLIKYLDGKITKNWEWGATIAAGAVLSLIISKTTLAIVNSCTISHDENKFPEISRDSVVGVRRGVRWCIWCVLSPNDDDDGCG